MERLLVGAKRTSTKFRHQLSARPGHPAVAKVFAVPRMFGPVGLRQQSRGNFEAAIERALHAWLLGMYLPKTHL